MPLAVGRPNSMAAIEAVLATEEKSFVVAAQRDADNEQPGLDDLFPIGTRAVVKKMARGEGVIELIVQGVERVSLLKAEQTEPFLKVASPAVAGAARQRHRSRGDVSRRHRSGRSRAGAGPGAGADQHPAARRPDVRIRCASPTCSARCSVSTWPASKPCSKRRRAAEALRLLHGYLGHEVQVLELRKKISTAAETEMSKQQRDYMLRQQIAGHPGRTGREKPGKSRGGRAAPPAGRGRPARRRPQGSRARTEPPGASAAGRARLSGDPHLSGLHPRTAVEEDDHGRHRPGPRPAGARRGPLRLEGDQGSHSGRPGGAEAEPGGARRRSCAWSARPASARPRWASRSPARWAASSSA